jgi:hypothetical protein
LIGYADDDDTEEIKGYKLIRDSDPSFVFYSSDVRFDETLPMLPLPNFTPFSDSPDSVFDLSYSDSFGEEPHSSIHALTRSYAQVASLGCITNPTVSLIRPTSTIRPTRFTSTI